jgi:propanol-preferring alcohol dehydrogenase
MRAMVLPAPAGVLQSVELPTPEPAEQQVLVKVHACGVCRTDLHVVDGELPHPKLPLIPGHEIVGRVVAVGPQTMQFKGGERVGIPWLGYTCGQCHYCLTQRENLCDHARFTGYQLDGGYAEYALADERYCFPLPASYTDMEAAPLLCAGLIGYRSWHWVRDAKRLGLYGFGAAAHIIIQIARHFGQEVYAFTRADDHESRSFAMQLGARWAGSALESPPALLDAAIIFAPKGTLVPVALKALAKGGMVVCAGIHMDDIPGFPYAILWGERGVRSVTNLTRQDALEFLKLAPNVPVRVHAVPFPLTEANEALNRVRAGKIQGAAVLTM